MGTNGGEGTVPGLASPHFPLATRRYRRFVRAGEGVDLSIAVSGKRLGSSAFMRASLGAVSPSTEIPRRQIAMRPPLSEIFAAEQAPIAAAYRDDCNRLRSIAEYLDCHYSTVSRKLRDSEPALDRAAGCGNARPESAGIKPAWRREGRSPTSKE